MESFDLNASHKTKSTPAGEIPVDWASTKLGQIIATLETGVSVAGYDRPAANGELGVLKVSAVSNGRFIATENKAVLPIEEARVRLRPQIGDILVSRSNSPELVGECALIKSVPDNLFLPDKLWQVRVQDEAKTSKTWLVQILRLPSVRLEVRNRASGTSQSMKNISQDAFLTITVPLPPLAEQEKIGAILDAWDEALERLDALIKLKERRRKVFMKRLLTGKQRLKNFSRPWSSIRFEQLLRPEDRYVTFDDDHTYNLVSIRRRSGGVYFREALQGSEIKTKVMKQVHSGDFLISRMQVLHGALGMVRLGCDGMYASDSYEVLVARDPAHLYMPFLDWMSRLRSFWHIAYICSHGVHIEKMTFNLDNFMRERITIPSDIAEQQDIVTILDTYDEELRLLRSQRAALEQQKRGLMQRLLTGKVRVKPDHPTS